MSDTKMNWVDEKQKEIDEERAKGYFNIAEGDNRFQLLTHLEPVAMVYEPATKKYRAAVEGEKGASIKGVGWVLQEGLIKEAKLPYTVVKAVKALMEEPDYAFEEFPMPYAINVKAKGAKTKEVEYTVLPSPKQTPVAEEVLIELRKKPSPGELVEKIKNRGTPSQDLDAPTDEPPLSSYDE